MPKEFLTTIIVNQKQEFPDPRAEKLQKQLNESGLSIKSVKIGKRFEIKHQAKTMIQAKDVAQGISEKLLVNFVTEEVADIGVEQE